MANGTYKLQAVGHMYTKGDPTGLTKSFLDYMLSPAVQTRLIPCLFYAPVAVRSASMRRPRARRGARQTRSAPPRSQGRVAGPRVTSGGDTAVASLSTPTPASLIRPAFRDRFDLPRRATLLAAAIVVVLVVLLLGFIAWNGIQLFFQSGIPISDDPQHDLGAGRSGRPGTASCPSSPARSG